MGFTTKGRVKLTVLVCPAGARETLGKLVEIGAMMYLGGLGHVTGKSPERYCGEAGHKHQRVLLDESGACQLQRGEHARGHEREEVDYEGGAA